MIVAFLVLTSVAGSESEIPPFSTTSVIRLEEAKGKKSFTRFSPVRPSDSVMKTSTLWVVETERSLTLVWIGDVTVPMDLRMPKL